MSSTYVDDVRDRAFERLYRRYVREVYRYVLAVLRNPAEAEDVTQTTFLNAYRALQAGAEPQKAHNWLIAIAHNACRSRVRFAMRRPRELPIDEIVEQLAMPESERVNVGELLRALGQLPFNQRAALTMRELEGRSYPEIAETLGVSVPAVEALIGRARKAMRLQAASLRGLAVIQLPRSLRRLVESGDAAGGTIGAGVAAKAAAILVAGVVAGGVGYTADRSAHHRTRSAVPPLELSVQPVTHRAPAVLHRHASNSAPKRTVVAVRNSRRPARASHVPRVSPDTVEDAAAASATGRVTPPAGPPPVSSSTPQPAPAVALPSPQSAPAPLPAQPVQAVQAVSVQLPPVQLPAVPDPPPLPTLPPPPPLP